MRRVYLVEYTDPAPLTRDYIALHVVVIPEYGDPDYRRSNQTLAAWVHHWREVSSKTFGRGMRLERGFWNILFEEDWKMQLEFFDMRGPEKNPLRSIPKHTHGNIWNFYTALGWDYKRKKFLTA